MAHLRSEVVLIRAREDCEVRGRPSRDGEQIAPVSGRCVRIGRGIGGHLGHPPGRCKCEADYGVNGALSLGMDFPLNSLGLRVDSCRIASFCCLVY